jgi:hypothetical protein
MILLFLTTITITEILALSSLTMPKHWSKPYATILQSHIDTWSKRSSEDRNELCTMVAEEIRAQGGDDVQDLHKVRYSLFSLLFFSYK